MDLFKKCYEFTAAEEARRDGYYPYFIPFTGGDSSTMTVDGDEKIMLGSNNYLGLTHHPELINAAKNALDYYGTGRTGSRFLNGTLDIHEDLERDLAEFVGKQRSLVFSTGYSVNLGVISTLVGRDGNVVLDKLDHASITDGAILSHGKIYRFRHNDIDDLKRIMDKIDHSRGTLLVVDGIYSMEGDIAQLDKIVSVVKEFGVRIMVDDAHSLGVLGPMGDGTAAHFGLTDEVDLIMGTFSKSFAGVGGFIAGDKEVIDYLQHHTRSLIFTASMPPCMVASTHKALEIIKKDVQRRERLWEIARFMKKSYDELGFNTGSSETPVIPIIIGDDMLTFTFWKRLFEEGIYTNPVISPAVPEKTSRLRTSYIATMKDDQLHYVLEVFNKVGKELGII